MGVQKTASVTSYQELRLNMTSLFIVGCEGLGCCAGAALRLWELCPGHAASAVVAHALEVVLGGSSPGA